MKGRPAVFIDRDGTISEEVGYVNHPSRYRVFPYSAEAVRLLNDAGWLAVLVTNQAGVARGYFAEEMIGAVHDRLAQELERGGARLDAFIRRRSRSSRPASSSASRVSSRRPATCSTSSSLGVAEVKPANSGRRKRESTSTGRPARAAHSRSAATAPAPAAPYP